MFVIRLVRLWLTGCNLHMSVVVISVPIELSMISTGRNLRYCLRDSGSFKYRNGRTRVLERVFRLFKLREAAVVP